ncbi:butyrophilin-like protein 3 [Equus caballus]|uniref:butyrophilin-like protein 3 n=1 Tax=Equus caballus TaxID=9796 RepID=UPI0038B2F263
MANGKIGHENPMNSGRAFFDVVLQDEGIAQEDQPASISDCALCPTHLTQQQHHKELGKCTTPHSPRAAALQQPDCVIVRLSELAVQVDESNKETQLVKNSIAEGHVSLRLEEVTPLDAGLYGCWFRSQVNDQAAIWGCRVSSLGSALLTSIMGYVDGGIHLPCKSSRWFPQCTVKWKGPQGHDLLSDSKANTDRHSLFAGETSFTVQENAGSTSCVGSRIRIGETFFQPSAWRLPSILLGLLCFVLGGNIKGLRISFPKDQAK